MIFSLSLQSESTKNLKEKIVTSGYSLRLESVPPGPSGLGRIPLLPHRDKMFAQDLGSLFQVPATHFFGFDGVQQAARRSPRVLLIGDRGGCCSIVQQGIFVFTTSGAPGWESLFFRERWKNCMVLKCPKPHKSVNQFEYSATLGLSGKLDSFLQSYIPYCKTIPASRSGRCLTSSCGSLYPLSEEDSITRIAS